MTTSFQNVSRLFLHLHHYVLRATHFHYQKLVMYSLTRQSFDLILFGSWRPNIHFYQHLGSHHMPSLLLFLSFLTFTKTYFILCCSCKALGFTGFKVVSYVDFSKYGATLPYNISLLFYSFSSPPVDSLVLIICFCIMLLSIFIISSAFIFSIDTVSLFCLFYC